MRFRTRADANTKEIDKGLRGVGASVVALGSVGDGCPDRLVGFRGRTHLLEYKTVEALKEKGALKDRTALLTPAQTKFMQTWQGEPAAIVFNLDEALKAIGA